MNVLNSWFMAASWNRWFLKSFQHTQLASSYLTSPFLKAFRPGFWSVLISALPCHYLSHEKNPLTFDYTGCLIEILAKLYYNPNVYNIYIYNWGFFIAHLKTFEDLNSAQSEVSTIFETQLRFQLRMVGRILWTTCPTKKGSKWKQHIYVSV